MTGPTYLKTPPSAIVTIKCLAIPVSRRLLIRRRYGE